MDELCDELAAEQDDLDGIVAGADLDVPTPAPGWTIRDQISHLWWFDQRALLALSNPDAFRVDAEWLMQNGTERANDEGRALARDELLERWRSDRRALVAHARTVDPKPRVPWYGPSMGVRSFITARLMETWAHGQDIVDGLRIQRAPTDRLRHVAHIGIGARRFSYAANQRQPNEAPIRIELGSPAGGRWEWGPDDATDRITGPALDFCLLVTQRRHRGDVELTVQGPAANEWLDIAQAFAGPPGAGRQPGQHRR